MVVKEPHVPAVLGTVALLASMFQATQALWAEGMTTGSIRGTVGATVPDATVTENNDAKGTVVTATTTADARPAVPNTGCGARATTISRRVAMELPLRISGGMLDTKSFMFVSLAASRTSGRLRKSEMFVQPHDMFLQTGYKPFQDHLHLLANGWFCTGWDWF